MRNSFAGAAILAIYVLVDPSGAIVNRIELAKPQDFPPPAGHTIVLDKDGMAIGGTYRAGVYAAPPAAPSAFADRPTRTDRQKIEDALGVSLDALKSELSK